MSEEATDVCGACGNPTPVGKKCDKCFTTMSEEAKEAAQEWRGPFTLSLQEAYALGYDAATAKLRELRETDARIIRQNAEELIKLRKELDSWREVATHALARELSGVERKLNEAAEQLSPAVPGQQQKEQTK